MNRPNSADLAIIKGMRALERGDYSDFEAQLNELDRLSHYARCFPSWRGMHNLTHVMRAFVTQVLSDNHLKEKPKFNLVAIDDDL